MSCTVAFSAINRDITAATLLLEVAALNVRLDLHICRTVANFRRLGEAGQKTLCCIAVLLWTMVL